MKNLFNVQEAAEFVQKYHTLPKELALRVYTSRLIGGEPGLVLHGGGNTSVKMKTINILGDQLDIIYVKGSGQDLSTINHEGFVGLDLDSIQRLRALSNPADRNIENHLRTNKVDADAPDPSVEALLHSFLPHKYVDHTHADSLLILTNLKNGEDLVREALGPKVAVSPYFMSGHPLAKKTLKLYESDPSIEAIVILNHGIFTFGDDAETSYTRMIDYVNRAESYINDKLQIETHTTDQTDVHTTGDTDYLTARFVQTARGMCAHRDSNGKLRRFFTEIRNSPDIVEVSISKQAGQICSTGVIVPDHAIWTKNNMAYIERIPESDENLNQIVTESIEAFKSDYDKYVTNQLETQNIELRKLDPYPRTFLVGQVGIVALGFTRKEALIAADIAEHTVRSKRVAIALGEYAPISDSHIFDMEYWPLQRKKIDKTVSTLPLQGQIAVLTGAAGAIGLGIADRLIAAGAVVVICDIDENRLQIVHSILSEKYSEQQVESAVFDVTDFGSTQTAFNSMSKRLGGIDILVPNAGIAHVSKIETMDLEKFSQVVQVNLMGTLNVIKASIPIFRRQGTGGSIVLISSKNVFDPGAAFGAYSSSKAAAHQISKIAALELAELGVRVNMINPDAVFGDKDVPSQLWGLIGPDRMKSRGLDPEGLKEYYRQRNLLKVSVRAEHVGNAVVFFADDENPITGATIPVDGGVASAFPR
ncbi:MAG: bifunctional aldolase/short-chain dehydrogenase [Proteobacteria bacterium]|nr:bifunctional aldolase/short-chain dehydrogenase [Pseudomonadota bacterium]